MATQLYDSESQAIYPNTQADAVSVNTGKTDINNVQSAIQDLYKQVANKNGDQAAISNLTFEISYTVSNISDAEQIKNEIANCTLFIFVLLVFTDTASAYVLG